MRKTPEAQRIMDNHIVDDQAKRIFLYKWFANLFAKEIDETTLALYRTDTGQGLLAEMKEIAAIAPTAQALREYAQKADPISSIVNSLASSFAFLFLGSGGKKSVPPYESAFTGTTGRLYQAPASKMEALLLANDLSPGLLASEPADHLAIQLSLLAHLCEQGSTDKELAFLENHLLVWVADFACACKAHDQEGFYGTAAVSLVGWLKDQRDALHIQLADLQKPKN
ncbi:MAG TPA: hypothetical protein DCS30_06245 [Rhizobiales bacterium]|nr:hypothetical protein [Hyphomicrobiales bacterium]